jgi:hypothetical protein
VLKRASPAASSPARAFRFSIHDASGDVTFIDAVDDDGLDNRDLP